ncbi:MAG: YggS family pyridoxal phosphate-dependent enzyme [Pseudomonadota bacterium]
MSASHQSAPSDGSAINPAARIAEVQARIDTALAEANAEPRLVTITAVSKKHTAETIKPALAAGHRVFGENRVQEAMAKWPDLRADFQDIQLRLIGPLQSNKAKDAVAHFDAIETIDRPKIAKAIALECERQGRAPSLLIQINTGEEDQKAGVGPLEADAFIKQCTAEFGLRIDGVMCIPPIDEPPSPHFALLAAIAERNGLAVVSMGMSADFETAVQLGATHIRVGSQIFGPRPT